MARLITRNGRVYPVEGELIKVGRSPENHVVLNDCTVSRFHAHILRREDKYYLHDLESTRGVYLNGSCIPTRQDTEIHYGDVIRIGDLELRYIRDDGPETESTALLNEKNFTISMPSSAVAVGPELLKHHLEMIARIAKTIESVTVLEDLLGTLMEMLLDLFHPDRVVILLSEGAEGKLVPKLARPDQAQIQISSTIVQHAVEQRVALLVADTVNDDRFNEAQSIIVQSIQAAICCPLVCKDKVLGAIYLDTRVNLFTCQDEDLVLLNLIAANAAIAIENALLIQEKRASWHLGTAHK